MTRHHGKFISYLRVSTKRQGASGLGLEAQRQAVALFLNGGNWQLVQEHVEVESGKHVHNRPALQAALTACAVYNATLVIAKIDRLSRDPVFLLSLRDAGIDFVAADMPNANRLTVGIMAMVAEQEREFISQRTKAALQAAKARGTNKKGEPLRLGNPTGKPPKSTKASRARGHATATANANAFAVRLRPIFTELDDQSARAIARELQRRGIATPRGGQWTAGLVQATRKRLQEANDA